jgi:hypothetical protein
MQCRALSACQNQSWVALQDDGVGRHAVAQGLAVTAGGVLDEGES